MPKLANATLLAQARSLLILKVLPRWQILAGFLGCYHQKSWVTEAAASAAIDHFRAWVDGGRRKQTAAATARRSQPAAEDVVLLPERYSERRNFRVRVGAMLGPVSRASGVVVKLMLLTSVHTTTRNEYNRAWSRSSDALRAVRKRRAQTFDVARALGQTVADAELAGAADWRRATAVRVAIGVIKGRGKARGQHVGMHRNRRADTLRWHGHGAYREHALAKLELKLQAAHKWRVEHIERLKTIEW